MFSAWAKIRPKMILNYVITFSQTQCPSDKDWNWKQITSTILIIFAPDSMGIAGDRQKNRQIWQINTVSILILIIFVSSCSIENFWIDVRFFVYSSPKLFINQAECFNFLLNFDRHLTRHFYLLPKINFLWNKKKAIHGFTEVLWYLWFRKP